MFVPRLIMAVAWLNLLFLFTELALNVTRAFLG